MPWQTGVLEALHDYGIGSGRWQLIFWDGWERHGSSTFTPHGSVNHHTAGSPNGAFPSGWILYNGRTDLPGPLCNHGLDRLVRFHFIAAGRANHAGTGSWQGITGNSNVWGLEVEHVGTTAEPVTDEQWEAMHAYHAAVGDYSGFTSSFTCQHFEWAPTRKVDFVKAITNPHTFRQAVADAGPQGEDDLPYTEQELTEIIKKAVGAAMADHAELYRREFNGLAEWIVENVANTPIPNFVSDTEVPFGEMVGWAHHAAYHAAHYSGAPGFDLVAPDETDT